MNFTERQLKILVALAKAGSDGRTGEQIREAWGWDGTGLDETKFAYDWEKLNCQAVFRMWPKDCMVYGPFYLKSEPGGPKRYGLTSPGRDYLIENGII